MSLDFYLTIKFIRLTFLNTSRVHEMLPKHSNKTGCCKINSVVGSMRFKSFENEFQLHWYIMYCNSPKAPSSLWPISHVTNNVQNE